MKHTTKSLWQRFLDFLNGESNETPAHKKAQSKSTPPAKTEPYVFITKSGKKFHYDADCSALNGAWERNEVIKMDLSKARRSGRTACSRCCWDYLR